MYIYKWMKFIVGFGKILGIRASLFYLFHQYVFINYVHHRPLDSLATGASAFLFLRNDIHVCVIFGILKAVSISKVCSLK